MSWQSESKQCKLSCPWMDTHMCVLAQLSPEVVENHHISLGVACGLRAVFEPHPLPPCISSDGFLEWKIQPGTPGANAAARHDELGSAWIE